MLFTRFHLSSEQTRCGPRRIAWGNATWHFVYKPFYWHILCLKHWLSDYMRCLFHVIASSKEEAMIMLIRCRLNCGVYTAICHATSKSVKTAFIVKNSWKKCLLSVLFLLFWYFNFSLEMSAPMKRSSPCKINPLLIGYRLETHMKVCHFNYMITKYYLWLYGQKKILPTHFWLNVKKEGNVGHRDSSYTYSFFSLTMFISSCRSLLVGCPWLFNTSNNWV